MKIACFTLIEAFTPLEHQMAKIREMGFDCCDIAATHDGAGLLVEYGFSSSVSLDGNPFDVKRMAEKHNLEIISLCAHANLLAPQAAYRFGTTQIIKAVKFAHALGIPHVVTSEGEHEDVHKLSEREMLEFIKNNLAEPLKVAEDFGVEILMEPHGPLSTSADGLLKILEVCDSESLAINYDTGNVFVAGNDPVDTLKAVVDKVEHVHFKDLAADIERGHAYGAGMGTIPLGTGACGIKTIVEILKEHGFDGNATLEVAGDEALVKSKKFLESFGI